MITADKVFKGNTEILKIFKGMNLEWEKVIPIPSADAYVQDGLVFQLDGIDKGNVEGAWVDRKAGRQFTLNNCIVNSDNIEFNGTDSEAIDNDNYTFPTVPENYTIEVVLYYGGGSGILTENSTTTSYGSPMMVTLYSTSTYFTIGRNLYAVEALPENKYMCLQAQAKGNTNTIQVNCNGDVLATRGGSIINNDFFAYGKASVGCVWTSSSDRAGQLLGKVYSIRLYNRLLTEEERYNNMVVDYMRFRIPIMDEFKMNLTNDLGEKITKAQFIINNTLFNSTESVYVPKSSHYFIQFNNIKNHTASGAILDPKSKNINATYHYTGFEGMIFEATVTDSDKAVSLPFYNAINQVDWGDGTSSNYTNYHTYSASGTYTIKLLGDFTNVKFYNDRATNVGKNVTKILQFPYNITISNGYMEAPNLTYLAPLIANEQVRVYNNVSANYIDCYSGIAYVHSGGVNSSYIDRRGSYPTYSKDIDTLVLTYDGYHSQTSLQSIQHLYKCTESSDDTIFLVDGSRPPYLSTISKFTNIRYMEIPEEFWQFFGKSINWDFSTLSYWGTEGNKQCVVNSLINNTVDLVSKGEKSQTITLSSPTKALLTSDEIAQITSKGYTIA